MFKITTIISCRKGGHYLKFSCIFLCFRTPFILADAQELYVLFWYQNARQYEIVQNSSERNILTGFMSCRDVCNHYIKLNINAVYFFSLFYCNDIPTLTRKGVFAGKKQLSVEMNCWSTKDDTFVY